MAIWYCIPPANYLETMKDWPYHMIIAPHLMTNGIYYDFYIENGDKFHSIIDNGLWEGQVVSNANLLKGALYCGCEEIIAPDHVSGAITVNRTKKFIDFLKQEGRRQDFKIHGVIHGKKWSEVLKCLDDLLALNVDVISIPKSFGSRWREQWLLFIKQGGCKLHDSDIPVHFLGYYMKDASLLKGNAARSFDTSVPFKPRYGEKFNLNLPYTLRNRIIISNRVRRWKKVYTV